MSVRAIKADERRARLGVRHRLADPADTIVEVVRSLVAVHGTDPASVYLAVRAQMPDLDIGALERALYDDRSEQVPELGDQTSLIAGGVGAVLGKQALVALNALSALFGRLVGRDVQ